MINKVILIGRLTKDPELRKTQTGISNCSFSLCCERNYKKDGAQSEDFPIVVAWNKTADNITKYCTKGSLIAVEGRLQTRNFKDKNNRNVFVTEVVAESVQFLKTSKDAQTSNGYPSNGHQNTQDTTDNPYVRAGIEDYDDSLEIDSDDLPF